VAAGVFGSTSAAGLKSGTQILMVALSGALANYVVSSVSGGAAYEKTANILNPLAPARNPFAVINLRMAVLAVVVSLWQCL
jgi:hypothetical protein